MKKRNESWYDADKGFHFVLTEKGKYEVASYHHKTVGEPVDEYDTEAVWWAVESGYVIEVPIPDWVVKPGYEVVRKINDNSYLFAGNPTVFPEREIAEKYLKNWDKRYGWNKGFFIRDAVYEGRALKDCRFYEGKRVHNGSWYYGPLALNIGDLVEEEIVDDLVNMLPPACQRSSCTQCGSPASHVSDENGNCRATYTTFKLVAENTWEYCGECFRGENEPPQ